jgi:hypothetical protein
MSSPPRPSSSTPQRTLSSRNSNSGGDRDAPGEGRLATVPATRGPPSALTKGGNAKMKFTPKSIGRKSADG